MNPDGNGFTHIAELKNKLRCMINTAKKKSFHNTVQYMYGAHIPHDTNEALELDEENGNDNWKKDIRLKIHKLMDYDTFHDKD